MAIQITVVVTDECEGLLHSLPRGYEYGLVKETDNRVTFIVHDVDEMTSGMYEALDTNPEVISYTVSE